MDHLNSNAIVQHDHQTSLPKARAQYGRRNYAPFLFYSHGGTAPSAVLASQHNGEGKEERLSIPLIFHDWNFRHRYLTARINGKDYIVKRFRDTSNSYHFKQWLTPQLGFSALPLAYQIADEDDTRSNIDQSIPALMRSSPDEQSSSLRPEAQTPFSLISDNEMIGQQAQVPTNQRTNPPFAPVIRNGFRDYRRYLQRLHEHYGPRTPPFVMVGERHRVSERIQVILAAADGGYPDQLPTPVAFINARLWNKNAVHHDRAVAADTPGSRESPEKSQGRKRSRNIGPFYDSSSDEEEHVTPNPRVSGLTTRSNVQQHQVSSRIIKHPKREHNPENTRHTMPTTLSFTPSPNSVEIGPNRRNGPYCMDEVYWVDEVQKSLPGTLTTGGDHISFTEPAKKPLISGPPSTADLSKVKMGKPILRTKLNSGKSTGPGLVAKPNQSRDTILAATKQTSRAEGIAPVSQNSSSDTVEPTPSASEMWVSTIQTSFSTTDTSPSTTRMQQPIPQQSVTTGKVPAVVQSPLAGPRIQQTSSSLPEEDQKLDSKGDSSRIDNSGSISASATARPPAIQLHPAFTSPVRLDPRTQFFKAYKLEMQRKALESAQKTDKLFQDHLRDLEDLEKGV
ncbi:MAG: hypothetical protein Q9218_003543 [Villophora microphyllina]